MGRLKGNRPQAKEGMRVHVFSGQEFNDLGLGTITKVEHFDGDLPHYPSRIELDSGDITEGCECWWHPVIEGVTPTTE